MLHYIIVDDEVLIRRGLISKIKDIITLEIMCVGEAANGIEGLALIERENPEIIITDMKMSKMDGMEFLEIIAEKYPEKAIIVISGYKAFHYVSKAIEKKAVGYVLKPFSTEEIEKQLIKAADQIHQQRNLIKLKEKVALFEQKKEHDLLLKAILEPWNEEMGEASAIAHCKKNCFYLLITVYTRNGEAISIYEEICKEYLHDIGYRIIDNSTNKFQYFILLEVETEVLIAKMESKAKHIAQYMENKIQEGKLRIVIGEAVQGFEKLNRSYLICEKLLRQIFLSDRVSILFTKDLSENRDILYSEDYMKNLFRRLKYHAQDEKELLNDFFDKMNSHINSLGAIGNTCDNLIEKINEYAIQNNTETDAIMQVFYRRYLLQDHLGEMKKEITGYIILVLNSIKMASHQDEFIFDKMKEYIENNYNKKLTLQVLALHFYLSPAGCSSLLKETLNMSFNDFLATIRLKKAKQLLEETKLSAERISNEIGYSNPKYFFRIFKKMTGLTPAEYRNKFAAIGRIGG